MKPDCEILQDAMQETIKKDTTHIQTYMKSFKERNRMK